MSPTFLTLSKIAQGFGLSLPVLVSPVIERPERGHYHIHRAPHDAEFRTEQYAYRKLFGGDSDIVSVHISEIRAHNIDEFPTLHTHASRDYVHVLEGQILAYFEGRSTTSLGTGDGLEFDGSIPHAFVSGSDSESTPRVLWVSISTASRELPFPS